MATPKIVQIAMVPAVPLVHGIILVALGDDGSIWQRSQNNAAWSEMPAPGQNPEPTEPPAPGVVFS